MKKFILMLAAAVVVALPLFAQVGCEPGFYVSTFGGANFTPSVKYHDHLSGISVHTKVKPRVGYFVGAAVGTKLNNVRLETEFCYRRNTAKVHSHGSDITASHSIHLDVYSVLVNGYYDFDFCIGQTIKPYIGGGIGWGHNYGKARVNHLHAKHREDKFAWQLIAGLAIPVTNCVDLGLEYRYFNSNVSKVHNHDAGATLRFWF